MPSAMLHANSATVVVIPQSVGKAAARPVFACPIPTCTKTFRRRFSLKEHVAAHTGERAFVCSVSSCDRSFSTSGNLARHKRVQHPWMDVPLECLVDDCGCTFASERKLERHMAMVHFSGSSHTCKVRHCGCAFTTAGNLRRHMKQQHAENMDTATEAENDPVKKIAASRTTENDPAKKTAASPTTVDDIKTEPMGTHWIFQVTPQDTELMDVLSCLFD